VNVLRHITVGKIYLTLYVINLAYFLLIKWMLVNEIETNLKAWLGS